MKDTLKPNQRKGISKNNLEDLRYYDIKDPSVKTKKEKAHILTGEHPREMIATEAVFLFIKNICRKGTQENK